MTALVLASGSAQAALCNFDDDADPLCQIGGGLQWIGLGGQPQRTPNAPSLSPRYTVFNNGNASIGVLFDDPTDVDALNIVTWAAFQPDTIRVNGLLGGALVASVVLDVSPFYQTFALGSAFDSIDRLEFRVTFGTFAIDDFGYALAQSDEEVPEPAALALFGLGAAAAAALRLRARPAKTR